MADTRISALPTKATPVGADITNILDSAAANADKKVTLSSLPVSTATQTAIDAKVTDAIVDGVTTVAPSQNAVFDALALKEDVVNKATDFSVINNTLYPTVQAVQSQILNISPSNKVFMFSGTNSDIGGYESMPTLGLYTPAVEQSKATGISVAATLLEEFASDLNFPNTNALPVGIGIVHYEIERTSGSTSYTTYAEIYKRTSGGAETLLYTTEVSASYTSGRQQVTLGVTFSALTLLNTTDRLVVKIYATSASGSPTVTIYWDATTNSRFEVPFASASSTLQQVYNNSTTPEIITNSTLVALTLQRGSGADTDSVLEIKNGAGTTTAYIRGNGAGQIDGSAFDTNTTAPNATVPVVSIRATNAATNVDMAVVPKGTGAFTLAIADSTVTGGNKRGTNSVDLQTNRSTASQVVSGNNSFSAGYRNTVTSTGSAGIGFLNTVGGTTAMALGTSNTTSGVAAVAIGSGNSATGASSIATGQQSVTGALQGRSVHSSGQIAVGGDSQYSMWDVKASTTDATTTLLTLGGLASGSTTRILLPNNTAYGFTGIIVGKQTASTNCVAWEIKGLIVRGVGVGTTTLKGSPTITAIDNTAGWGTPTVTADTATGCLAISVVGLAATNIRWDCTLRTTEITYA
jgi:hypothetical protein